jgi:hypothetical protein
VGQQQVLTHQAYHLAGALAAVPRLHHLKALPSPGIQQPSPMLAHLMYSPSLAMWQAAM